MGREVHGNALRGESRQIIMRTSFKLKTRMDKPKYEEYQHQLWSNRMSQLGHHGGKAMAKRASTVAIMSNGHMDEAEVEEMTPIIESDIDNAGRDGNYTIKSREEVCSVDRCRLYLTYNTYEHQRPIRGHHVAGLNVEMRQGTFRQSTDICLGVVHGKKMLMDGQHRLLAACMCDIPQQFTIKEYHLDSMAQFASLYATFDRHLIRSHMDAMGAFGAAEEAGVTKSFIRRAISAFPLLSTGFGPRIQHWSQPIMRSSNIRYKMLLDWKREIHFYSDDLTGSKDAGSVKGNMMLRQAVMALAFVTYRYQQEKAHEFWSGIARDDGLKVGDPRKVALNFLFNNDTHAYSPSMYCRFLASAWNSFYASKERNNMRSGNAGNPIHIAGTPHTSRQVMVYVTRGGDVLHDPIPFE